MAGLFSKRFRNNDCIEKAFFKTIIIAAIAGCALIFVVDLLLIKRWDNNVHLVLVLIQILVAILFGINRIDFHNVALGGVLASCALITYRGLTTTEYNEITCTLLVTIGFISALVLRTKPAITLIGIALACLLAMLFKDYDTESIVILGRKALPYLTVYFIVTICSGILKSRYESNQERLRAMIRLLHNKNRKINSQHALLERNYRKLTCMNENLEKIIEQKTQKISEKNRQLAGIAYANAHTIRGPLARILGLLNLARLEPCDSEFYFTKINDEALEMDRSLTIVTREIEMNSYR